MNDDDRNKRLNRMLIEEFANEVKKTVCFGVILLLMFLICFFAFWSFLYAF